MMSTPSPGSYRILDEIENRGARKTKPPWSPTALFILTCLFAPLGAPLWAFNWGRLGLPEKRWPWLLLAAAGAWVLPVVVILRLLPISLDGHSIGTVLSGTSIALAFAFRLAQSPAHQHHEARGGVVANSWPIWIFLVLWLVLLFVPSWLAR